MHTMDHKSWDYSDIDRSTHTLAVSLCCAGMLLTLFILKQLSNIVMPYVREYNLENLQKAFTEELLMVAVASLALLISDQLTTKPEQERVFSFFHFFLFLTVFTHFLLVILIIISMHGRFRIWKSEERRSSESANDDVSYASDSEKLAQRREREQQRYMLIRKAFIKEHHLPDGFPFFEYISVLIRKVICSMAEGGWKKWLILWFMHASTTIFQEIIDHADEITHAYFCLSLTVIILFLNIIFSLPLLTIMNKFQMDVLDPCNGFDANILAERLLVAEEEYRDMYMKKFCMGRPDIHFKIWGWTLNWLSVQIVFFTLVYNDSPIYLHIANILLTIGCISFSVYGFPVLVVARYCGPIAHEKVLKKVMADFQVSNSIGRTIAARSTVIEDYANRPSANSFSAVFDSVLDLRH